MKTAEQTMTPKFQDVLREHLLEQHQENLREETLPPVTPKDLIMYALDFAFKQGAINAQERYKARMYCNCASSAVDALLKHEKGPVNCYPLGYARDAAAIK